MKIEKNDIYRIRKRKLTCLRIYILRKESLENLRRTGHIEGKKKQRETDTNLPTKLERKIQCRNLDTAGRVPQNIVMTF